jgi:hypothetical protein
MVPSRLSSARRRARQRPAQGCRRFALEADVESSRRSGPIRLHPSRLAPEARAVTTIQRWQLGLSAYASTKSCRCWRPPRLECGSLLPLSLPQACYRPWVGLQWAPASWPAESGTKVPHSKALRASNIFRAESRKMRRALWHGQFSIRGKPTIRPAERGVSPARPRWAQKRLGPARGPCLQ